ncbi:MAG TPA: hypothetical protein VGW33_10380 [Terriglobia bacterium]|nr:hypothetical protein [Terriglobia bacterium]
MITFLLTHGLQYAGYGLEAGLFAFLLWRGGWKRELALWLYVSSLLTVDFGLRWWVLSRYGERSHIYYYFYYVSDALLTLGAFGLVCSFFRRVLAKEERLWAICRLTLPLVFCLTLALSSIALFWHYKDLFTRFVFSFQQSLYFACLVLNTLLYIVIQQVDSADEEVGLLVCGLGIQLAGTAAGYALISMTRNTNLAIRQLLNYISPLCFVGMLLIWFCAVARPPRAATSCALDKKQRFPAPA